MRSPLATLLVLLLLVPAPVWANPKGGHVRIGNAQIQTGAGRVDVNQASRNAVITWDSFDIAPGEVTQFHQPGSDAVAINRIFQGNASQILGSLQANGHVYLINPNGILFGKEATVNVHALIATTTFDGHDLAAQGFDPSSAAAPGAQIVNQGHIASGAGGFVYLVAPYVRNGKDGVIVSPEGQVQIEAGATVLLTDRPDGSAFAIQYTAPGGGEAVNLGQVFADGGYARMRASLVTQGGLVQANAIREHDGKIELVADDTLTLASGSVTRAAGGADAGAHAGTVDAWSDGTARMDPGARIDVSASAAGANGGFAELSAAQRVDVAGSFSAGAGKGGTKGQIVIDPDELVISGPASFRGAGSVKLEADHSVSVASGASIDLARLPGDGSRSGRQTLEITSGGDVTFERDALISDSGTGKIWDVSISAGESGSGARSAGGGDLVFEGGAGSGLRLARGNVRGVAADDVVLFDGASMSSIDGDIDVAAGGNVIFDAGRTPGVDTVIESGSGNVSVVAEGSVLLQRSPGSGGNAAIRTRGVYGTDGDGNVTKTDGGDILVWAKHGDVDAGIANRWVEPGPSFRPNGPERDEFHLPPGPEFDPIPVVDRNNAGPGNQGNRDDLSDGILGIGTEAGGSVVVLAGGDVKTHATSSPSRIGGTATGRGTTYDGAHIGAFGVPVVYEQDPGLDYHGAVPLADAPENRVIVVAGGDISGDYGVRNGEATLLAGYSVKPGVDTVADLATLGLDRPVGVERDQLRAGLDVSSLAAASEARGWVGSLADPITVDLIYGSVDMLGRNGVAVRAVENPSLVYPESRVGSTASYAVATYADDSAALLEAETGDVVLIGNDARLVDPTQGGVEVDNGLVRLLPPSLVVRTHAEDGERPGDLVQVEDFTLFPSADGGLTLDLAGKARTANGVASGQAVVTISAITSGNAADVAFTIPNGTLLRDPETGLVYQLSRPIGFDVRRPAEPATVKVSFEALPGFEDREIVIPIGTRVEDYAGRIFTTTTSQSIPALANRLSVGEVRFVPTGGRVNDPAGLTIPVGTQLRTPTGALFEVTEGASLQVGDRAVTLAVRSVQGTAVADALPGQLSLVTPIAGVDSATNRFATQRPATADILFSAVVPGQSDSSRLGRIKTLLDPIPGARFLFGEAPQAGGGSDTALNGTLLTQPAARAQAVGPVGEIRTPHTLELVDPSILPAGVSLADLQIIATSTETSASLIPAVTKQLGSDGRPDLSGNRIQVVDSAQVWERTGGGSVATIHQSDADPGYDARNLLRGFDYAKFYQLCRSGATCGDVLDPFTETPLHTGSGPTHRGDREVADLHARLGFERIGFDLAEAATMLAGPGEDEEFDGQQADIIDASLATQHANPGDVTSVLAPYGDILFASEVREVRDRQTGLTVALPGNAFSGVTVAGSGSLVVRAGVLGEQSTGIGGRLGLSQASIGNSSGRGIETIGNVVNAALPLGSATIDIVTAGDIELHDRGSIDTLQGGHIGVRSIEGGLFGGAPDPLFTAKRGIFTLFVPGGSTDASPSGGGSIDIDVFGDFNIGKSVAAALSGGDISLRSRTGSISAGDAVPFEILGVSSSPTSNLPEVNYKGGGIFASTGTVTIVADKDVDIGAGITAGAIAIAAGGNINAGQGSIQSSGNISIDAGGTISGTISASGAISIGSGTVTQSASLSAGGLVVGAGSVGSNSGPGKVGADTAVAASRPEAEQAAGQNALAGGTARRSGVNVDVTSRPASGSDEDLDCGPPPKKPCAPDAG